MDEESSLCLFNEYELEPTNEPKDYSCKCESCQFNAKWKKNYLRIIAIGIFLPFIWFLNIALILYGCFYLPRGSRCGKGNIAVGSRRSSLVDNNAEEVHINDTLHSHEKLKKQCVDLLLYTLGAAVIYATFVVLIVLAVLYPPVTGAIS